MELLRLTLDSICFGAVVALVSLGLGVVFGVLKVVNLAHGDLVTIGAYLAVLCHNLHLPFAIAVLLAPILGFGLGALIEKFVVRSSSASAVSVMVSTWALGLIIQQVIQWSFGPEPRSLQTPDKRLIQLFDIQYPAYRLELALLAISLLIATWFIGFKTRFGVVVRACISNPALAAISGIDVQKIKSRAFAFGSSLAVLAGVLVAPLGVIVAQMGHQYLTRSFIVVILSFSGILSIIGNSILVGGGEVMLSEYWSPTFSQVAIMMVAAFAALIRSRKLMKQ